MGIIASHRLGLIEQLEGEAIALAGRPREAVQRAIVCYHVSDMLGHAHDFALLAARASLALDDALAGLDRAVARGQWRLGRGEKEALAARVAVFGEALRAIDAERCAGLLMAYRLVATPGLGGEAAGRLDPALVAGLQSVLATRGAASEAERRALFDAHCARDAGFAGRIDAALEALAWPLGRRAPTRAIAALVIAQGEVSRIERQAMPRVEQALRRSKRMPPDFAANPAQAFFKLQRRVIEQRRGDGADHPPPDEAVRLAA